jgi:DNA-binding CsgD family transcriptional regulator
LTHEDFASADWCAGRFEDVGPGGMLRRDSGMRSSGAAQTANASLYMPLADILGAIGRPHFYRTLADQLSKLLGCDRYLVMRYSHFAKPAFLINNFMPVAVEDLYRQDLYCLDPLYGMVRGGTQLKVSTLREVRNHKGIGEYCDALFQYAGIYDELAMMLPLFGGLVIAICFDNESAPFEVDSVALALEVYPVIEQANRLHLARSLPGGGYGLLDGHSTAVKVTTSDREPVYQNDAWTDIESSALRPDIDRYMQSDFQRNVVHFGESVLHGHRLDTDSPVWPNGNIFFVERQSASSTNVDFASVLDAVAQRYRLSPRERDLFKMALQGCDSRRIARRLGLSVGTVKNYKHRLYAKLNISCERELASLLLSFLAGSESGAD